ncbi:MAG TPA: type 1 glutamine amidotransferase domain-containing protein [Longimicrobiaceae bacterium]|nr:type 1 glutamine amidotransferase domain-containing protein [Longimicrobiaceae bacterium]
MAKPNLDGLRVAILAADGVEQIELTGPRDELVEHGAEVEVVSLRPGSIQGMNLMKPGKKIDVDRAVSTADPGDYDALLLPGGHINPDFLRQSDRVLDFVRAMDRAGKPIAVICHAPWVLVSAGLVRGRRLTSWPGIRDDVRNAGGAWVDEAAVRDRNWVSSRGPQDLRKFNRAMLELFSEHAIFAEDDQGAGVSLGGLVASGLALAAIGYGLRQWQGGDGGEGWKRGDGDPGYRGMATADTRHVEADVAL